ncbi:hypothetical protein NL676_035027 [Syzygium grande]|nr:hypothetical protein NL676_035027 [Syzygium grande]
MSVLEHPDAFYTPELQIWNNAAFNKGESEDSVAVAVKASWFSANSIFVKLFELLDSDNFNKENRSCECANSHISLKSSIPSKLQWKQSVNESLSIIAKDLEDKGSTINVETEEIEKKNINLTVDSKPFKIVKLPLILKLFRIINLPIDVETTSDRLFGH